MAVPVGYHGLATLKVGDKVKYKAGLGDQYVEATAIVAQAPGMSGVLIQLGTISIKGEKVEFAEGEEITAGANEIYPLEE